MDRLHLHQVSTCIFSCLLLINLLLMLPQSSSWTKQKPYSSFGLSSKQKLAKAASLKFTHQETVFWNTVCQQKTCTDLRNFVMAVLLYSNLPQLLADRILYISKCSTVKADCCVINEVRITVSHQRWAEWGMGEGHCQ